jgi:hypothetical protein
MVRMLVASHLKRGRASSLQVIITPLANSELDDGPSLYTVMLSRLTNTLM